MKPGFNSVAVRWSWTSASLRTCSKAAVRIRVAVYLMHTAMSYGRLILINVTAHFKVS